MNDTFNKELAWRTGIYDYQPDAQSLNTVITPFDIVILDEILV